MTPLELRKRWRGMMRRRLMNLRGHIDHRIERLDEKQQKLHAWPTKNMTEPSKEEPVPVTGPAAPIEGRQRPPRRRPPTSTR